MRNRLFSYLAPKEYLGLMATHGFEPLFRAALIGPRAVKFLASDESRKRTLEGLVADPLDLLITGTIIIYRKPPQVEGNVQAN